MSRTLTMRQVRLAMRRIAGKLGLDWRNFFGLIQEALVATDAIYATIEAAAADGVWTDEEVEGLAQCFAAQLARVIARARRTS